MTKKDKRIDAYITKAQPFAQPVLKHLRALIHHAVPEVEETIKWGMPSFDYKGPLCSFAAFKQHCVFGFWKSKLLKDPKNYLGERFNQGGEAMGNLGKMTSIKDLPPDKAMLDFLKQAKKLNDDGVKLPGRSPKPKTALNVPDYFVNALKKNKMAQENFEALSPSQKKEYVEWFTDAKTEVTRYKRIQTAIDLLSEGKSLNWKYMRK